MNESLIETLLLVALFGLGTARLSALVSMDTITERLREMIFVYFPPDNNEAQGHYYQNYRKATPQEREALSKLPLSWYFKRFEFDGTQERPATFIGRLIACHKCVGVWIAAANAVFYWLAPDPAIAFNAVMAIAFVGMAANNKYYR